MVLLVFFGIFYAGGMYADRGVRRIEDELVQLFKGVVIGSLLVLIEVGRAWSWAAFIIITREVAVMGLRAVAALEKATVPPSFWGKSKTTFQFVAIGFALIRPESELGPFFFDEWLMLVAVFATVLSGWDYFRRYWSAFLTDEKVEISTDE